METRVEIEPMASSDQMPLDEIRKAYNEAARKEEIIRVLCERNGVDSDVIRQIIAGELDTLPPPKGEIDIKCEDGHSPEGYPLGWKDHWCALRKRGYTCREIAEIFRVNEKTVLVALRRRNK